MMKLLSFRGTPFLGVFTAVNESVGVIPPETPDAFRESMREALQLEALIETTMGGSTVVGSLLAMNSHGALVTDFASDEEIALLREHVPVERFPGKHSAVGNNVLVNDKGAIVNPGIKQSLIGMISDIFDVEVVRMPIGGIKTVGSACLLTNKGGLCHPYTTDEELDFLKEFFGLPFSVGTLNYGTGYVGACALANTKGAVVGDATTPIELGKLEDALELY